ncbi:cation transporter [Necropsobacter massiliensis]|uniref:cation transporter n=1 Tax=Necropsobacter massiliensis TaxID=1400001 RepID=UPI000509F822|nr:cation transporter [Necropsobacter massiliensis]
MTTTVLALSELSCQHCVKSVTKALQAIDGVKSAEVTLERATVVGDVDPQVLINAVIDAGYKASLANAAK